MRLTSLAETLQFGHGSSAVETKELERELGRVRSFNSATALQPWKQVNRTLTQTQRQLLQFGHGSSAVETRL